MFAHADLARHQESLPFPCAGSAGAPIPDEVLTSTLDQVVMALIGPR
jgi:hypothetical protein